MGRNSVLVLALAGAGCTSPYTLDMTDIDLEPPHDLDVRLDRFRKGEERWHGDPRKVADLCLRRRLDLPWKADAYHAELYEVGETPEWGTFVTRGYRYPSGHVMRYRVKVRPYREIWYPVQISRYKIIHGVDDGHGHGHAH